MAPAKKEKKAKNERKKSTRVKNPVNNESNQKLKMRWIVQKEARDKKRRRDQNRKHAKAATERKKHVMVSLQNMAFEKKK